MGWTRTHNAPDRFDYFLNEVFLRPLADGETRQALDAWTNDEGKNELSEWTPSPALNYRVWKDGKELQSFQPSDLGEVVSERWLTRAHSTRRIPMSPGLILTQGVVLFRTFHWDWECVLPTGRVRKDYRVDLGLPAPLSLVERVHYEHGLGLSRVERRPFGSLHKDVEALTRKGTKSLAKVTKAQDLDGRVRLYVKVKVAFDVEPTRRKLRELSAQEGWVYSQDSFFAQWLRGERADAGDQEGVFEAWARGGETVFGYTGDEIRLP